jgi:hypothetical protein
MSKTLATGLSLTLTANYANSSDLTGAADVSDQLSKTLSDTLATGTAIDCADRIYRATRTLAATTGEDLDLAGSLTDAFGATLTFARIKGILIKLNTTTAGYTLEVGGTVNQTGATATTNQFATWVGAAAHRIIVRADGIYFLWAPDVTAYAVTAGTGDLLKIYNPNAASITYDIILIGASA